MRRAHPPRPRSRRFRIRQSKPQCPSAAMPNPLETIPRHLSSKQYGYGEPSLGFPRVDPNFFSQAEAAFLRDRTDQNKMIPPRIDSPRRPPAELRSLWSRRVEGGCKAARFQRPLACPDGIANNSGSTSIRIAPLSSATTLGEPKKLCSSIRSPSEFTDSPREYPRTVHHRQVKGHRRGLPGFIY